MSGRISRCSRLAVAVALFGAAPAGAQTGSIAGTVTDVETGEPLASARVEVLGGPADTGATGVLADGAGRFRVTIDPGTYAVVVTLLGYETERIDGVSVEAGEATAISIPLTSQAFRLNPVIVSASRRQEKALDAPATVTVVDERQIEVRPAITALDHVRAVPGVDIASSGLTQSNIVTRGFNNVFSGALLMLTDNRHAGVPSLRVNASYLIPTSNEDIERIEVVLGPGAALYGPNSANGVVHIITRSPFDDPGTTVSVGGGTHTVTGATRSSELLSAPEAGRGIFKGAFRHAMVLGDRAAFKISGEYFQGGDFQYFDPVEDSLRVQLIRGGADPDDVLIGRRDFGIERWAGEARLDIRPDEESELIFAVGSTLAASNIELTQLGAAQAQNWRYDYYQARYRRNRLFAQVFLNMSDAGETFLLRTGDPIVDRSFMAAAQLQHGFDLGTRQSFIYGLDAQRTVPRTGGTITGRNEEDDEITELGAYLHSETGLASDFDLVAALRVDYHNRLDEPVLSPRAALVYSPVEAHNFRITYNRAFSTPTTNNLFLDILAAELTPLPYQVRAIGVPADGFQFSRNCGGLCMRTPFAPGQELPTDATLMWDAVVQVARDQVLAATGGQVDLASIPAPTSAEVGTVLRVLHPTEAVFYDVDPADVRDIDRLRPTITNTFELGYKGLIGNRLLLAGDLYYEQKRDFVGPLIIETPSVFLDRSSLAEYLGNFIPDPLVAGVIASELGGVSGSSTTGIPVGTVLPEGVGDDVLMLTYRNFGELERWGGDLAAEVILNDRFSLSGSYSYVSDDFFSREEVGGVADVTLNAPQHKGALGGTYRDGARGFTAQLRGRYVHGFPMHSGVYIGEIEPYTLVDATLSYALPFAPGAAVSVSARNLLNNLHREFLGAPEIGRVILTRLQYSF